MASILTSNPPSAKSKMASVTVDPTFGAEGDCGTRPGDILAGKYRVERVLGVGGMGIVVLATHLELDERVAVKFLLPTPTPNADSVARFVREARAAIKIRSEHVVRIFDVGRLDNGAPFIVMEYLEGADLSQVVERDGPLAVADAVDYLLHACEALASAHAMGIVHRDLKPANLFLTSYPDGTPCVKVLDFGISKFVEGDGKIGSGVTTTATIMGTPCFMSPEQLRSTRDVDARSDIWALGTILYALLTGAPPYYAETTADVAAKIIRDPPPSVRALRGDVPVALELVIARCLEKDREHRYPDVGALAEALAELGSDRAMAAATRIKRLTSNPHAVATAPTLRSNPPIKLPGTPPAAEGAPTRTASAWGASGPVDGGRRRTWLIVGAGFVGGSALLAVALAFGLARDPAHRPQASSEAPAQLRPALGAPKPPPQADDLPRAAGTSPLPSVPVAIVPTAPSGARHRDLRVGTTVLAAPSGKVTPPPSPAISEPKPNSGGLFDDPQ